MNPPDLQIKRGGSAAADADTAVRELAAAIRQDDAALTMFFCSPHYDRVALARAIRREFPGSNVIGCTTAGEISPLGYRSGTLSGVSIRSSMLRAVSTCIDLREMTARSVPARVDAARAQLANLGKEPAPDNTFGFLLVDGLSMQEEFVASLLHQSLHGIQLVGGSAADDANFGSTHVFYEGEFHPSRAVLTLVQTELPFHVFRTQHFEPSTIKMVVTGADPSRRLVHEINGRAAGIEFARAVGLKVAELTPMIFAAHPVVVRVGGEHYVRSIQKVNEDGSLTFFCAIDEGLVLTVARGKEMNDNLEAAFEQVRRRIGAPELVLACDCILRRIELEQRDTKQRAAAILERNNAIGFATYGEQFNAMHLNQTFTGVAIGSVSRSRS